MSTQEAAFVSLFYGLLVGGGCILLFRYLGITGPAKTPNELGRKWLAWAGALALMAGVQSASKGGGFARFITESLVVFVVSGPVAFGLGWLYGRFVKFSRSAIPDHESPFEPWKPSHAQSNEPHAPSTPAISTATARNDHTAAAFDEDLPGPCSVEGCGTPSCIYQQGKWYCMEHSRSASKSSTIAQSRTVAAPKIANVDEDAIYAQVAHELENKTTDIATWTKAFAECEGDDAKTKAHYIKLRFAKLKQDEEDRLRQAEKKKLEEEWMREQLAETEKRKDQFVREQAARVETERSPTKLVAEKRAESVPSAPARRSSQPTNVSADGMATGLLKVVLITVGILAALAIAFRWIDDLVYTPPNSTGPTNSPPSSSTPGSPNNAVDKAVELSDLEYAKLLKDLKASFAEKQYALNIKGWSKVGVSSDGNLTHYLDYSTFSRNGDVSRISELVDLKTPAESMKIPYSSTKLYVEYNCKERTVKYLTATIYSANMESGQSVHIEVTPSSLKKLMPNSMAEYVYSLVCEP